MKGANREGRSPVKRAAVAAGVVAGAAMRWWVLATPLGSVDYDEAVVGLMARNMQHGHFTMFFWGQPYGGSQEPAMVAVLFALFGPQRLALKAVPIVLHAGACLLTWRVGRRLGLASGAAATAGVVLWCFPAAFLWWSTKERGFYGLALLLGLAAVLVCLRLADAGSEPRHADLLGLGTLAGVGLWVSPEVSYLAVPAVAWLVVHHRRLVRHVLTVAGAAVVAASPWLVWNATHDWASLQSPVLPERHAGYLTRLGDFFTRLPVGLGIEEPFSGRSLFSVPHPAAVAAALALLASAAWVLRRHSTLLVWLAVGFGPLYASNTLVDLAGPHPRYLYLFTPVVALAVAALAGRAAESGWARRWRWPWPLGLALVVALAVSGWGLGVLHTSSLHAGGTSDLAAGPIHELVRRLDERHIDRVVTDRVGPQLTFATDERIIGSNYIDERHPAYRRLTQGGPRIVYVLQTDLGRPVRLERRLRDLGIGYRAERVARWTIVTPDRKVLP